MAENDTLDKRGFIYVTGSIDATKAEAICRRIMEINLGDAECIQMMINSPGGDVRCGFAILDLMDWSRVPVRTTGLGLVASTGLLLLMAGEKGHRVVTPRISLLSHRYSWRSFGNHSELVARRQEEDIMHERILAHYVEHTGLSCEQVRELLLRDVDTWLTAEQAKAQGLVDIVEMPRSKPPTIQEHKED